MELGARVTVVDSYLPEGGANDANLAGIENRPTSEHVGVYDEVLFRVGNNIAFPPERG